MKYTIKMRIHISILSICVLKQFQRSYTTAAPIKFNSNFANRLKIL